jgi:S1-C subfamily serine protease
MRRLRLRVVALAAAGLVAAGVGTGAALARSSATPIGTGVVVIETQLAYQNGAAAGTGMVLSSSGQVLTNNHVIRGATTLRIVVPGTGTSYTAKVVGYDVADDVAVLQAVGASNLKTVTTAASAKVAVGDAVTAVGNAGGSGSLTSSTGSVTGLQQSITVSDDQGGSERLTGLIETNAELQPGDSGGPLFNGAGKVIGMDTAASSSALFRGDAETQGFAIPIAKALSIAHQIASGQASATVHVGTTAFLGIQVESSIDAGGYTTGGAVISGVVPGGPAASAGLQPGDLITAIGGRSVSSPAAITKLVLAMKPGTKVTVAYTDEYGSAGSVRVTLGTGPAQ